MSKRPVALIIMDGFGYNPDAYGNAIRAAKKPNLEKYLKGPHTLIGAKRSGCWSAGRSDGQFGSRTHQYRCGQNRLSDVGEDHQGHRERNFLL